MAPFPQSFRHSIEPPWTNRVSGTLTSGGRAERKTFVRDVRAAAGKPRHLHQGAMGGGKVGVSEETRRHRPRGLLNPSRLPRDIDATTGQVCLPSKPCFTLISK